MKVNHWQVPGSHTQIAHIYIKSAHPALRSVTGSPTMGLRLALILSCLFFSNAMALNCYQCIPQISGTCTDTPITCADQCASLHLTSTTSAGPQLDMQMKNCATPADCVNGSMNLGIVKTTLTTKCCNTELCNSQPIPALPQQSPNGRSCYTCDGNTCSGTVACRGGENRCISVTAEVGGTNVAMKGCATQNICEGTAALQQVTSMMNMNCCEGNLCNGVNRVHLSFLLMLGPLLPSLVFY